VRKEKRTPLSSSLRGDRRGFEALKKSSAPFVSTSRSHKGGEEGVGSTVKVVLRTEVRGGRG